MTARRVPQSRAAIRAILGDDLSAIDDAASRLALQSSPPLAPAPRAGELTRSGVAELQAAFAEEQGRREAAEEERAAVIREAKEAVVDMTEKLEQARRDAAQRGVERDALREELDQRSGEVQALRSRLREEIALRADSVQRVELLENDLGELAGDVLTADVTRQRRGLFRRKPKAPSPRPSASRTPPSEDAAPADAVGAHEGDEELEALLDRRLFGD